MKVERLKETLCDLPEINAERGLRFSVNNVRNYRKSLYMVLKSIKFKLPLILMMVEENEYEGLSIIVHTLMQLLNNIGAESLMQECLQIETLLLNDNKDELDTALENYVESLAGFMVRLEALMPAIDTLVASELELEGDASLKMERANHLVEEFNPKRKTV